MKHISKTISLESFKSRRPGVIPAFLGRENDLTPTPVFFGDVYDSYNEWQNKKNECMGSIYSSNYGMIPCNTNLSGLTIEDGELKATGSPIGLTSSIGTNITTLSYRTLANVMHFLEEYYHLLYDYSTCGGKYTSAEDYFYQESKFLSIERLKYQKGIEFYKDLDRKFNKMGGGELYKYLTSNFFPSVKLLDLIGKISGLQAFEVANLVSAWNVKTFSYPDLVKWKRWFEKRYAKYKNYTNVENCKESSDCCDCEEYFKLGGNKMYTAIKNAINQILAKIKNNNGIFKILLKNANEDGYPGLSDVTTPLDELEACRRKFYAIYPSMMQDIEVRNHVNLTGSQDLFGTKWEKGLDYTQQSSGGYTFIVNNGRQRENVTNKTQHIIKVISKKGNALDVTQDGIVNGGTIVYHNGEAYIIQSDKSGYKFDDKFNEIKFGNDLSYVWKTNSYNEDNTEHWSDYTGGYINANPSKFFTKTPDNSGVITSYAYKNDGTIVYNPSESDLRLSNQYDIDTNNGLGYTIIDWDIVPIQEYSYITDTQNPNPRLKNRKYLVERTYTNTPFITYNHSKLYASRRSGEWVIEICGNNYSLAGNGLEVHKVANHGGKVYEILSNNILYGFTVVDGKTYVIKDKNINDAQDVIRSDGDQFALESSELNVIAIVNDVLYVGYEFEKYQYEVITGYTESKLDVFREQGLTDGVGNEFPCLNQTSGDITDKQVMALPFTVGKYTNVQKQEVEGKNGSLEAIYWGDYLQKIEFYLETADGKRSDISIETTSKLPRTGSGGSIGKFDSIGMINNILAQRPENSSEITDRVHCVFTYFLGNSLHYNETSGNFYIDQLGNDETGYTELENGVKYVEDVVLRRVQNYYYDDVSLPPKTIFYYEVERERETTYSGQYGGTITSSLAKFRTRIPRLQENGKYQTGYGEEYGFDKYMNQIVFPTYMQEYQANISSPEIVDGDIYIDRGSAASFEKLLKLGEVSTLSALEQYSNGFFKISKNS